jgi:hypothetical protein
MVNKQTNEQTNKRTTMNYKTLTAIATAALLASAANAEWHYGIGSGIGSASYDGDVEFGAGKLDVDYDSSDMESAFGGSAFATNGTWVFNLSGSAVEYESKDTIKNSGLTRTKNKFEQSGGEFTVGYVFYREDDITITPFAGIRVTEHEWTISGDGPKLNDDANWTDGIFGVKVDYAINDEWTWNNSASYAGGDSEGCTAFQTGVSWKFAENWVTGAFVKFVHDEFEETNFSGEKYTYDTDVTTFGISIAYVW